MILNIATRTNSGSIAQQVEQLAVNQPVLGSSPSGVANYNLIGTYSNLIEIFLLLVRI